MKKIKESQRSILRNLLDVAVATWYEGDLEDYLPEEYKQFGIGNNSVVFEFPGTDKVIKVGKDAAYQRFVRWCRKNPCPQLPKIYYMYNREDYFVAVIEKLSPYNDDETLDILDREDIDKYNLSRNMKKILNHMFNMWDEDNTVVLDLQGFNFMKRGKTVVIVDPLYPANNNDIVNIVSSI